MRIRKREKELLSQAFVTPEAKKKRAFLRTLPKQEVGIGELILSQAPYIRKWVWFVSAIVFGVAVLLSRYMLYDTIWVLASLMPFMALSVVLELAKSSAYGMAELEMTSRFSMRTILLARMAMIGMFQFFVLVLMTVVFGTTGVLAGLQASAGTVARSGLYLLTPYLLTTVLGLMAVKRIHGKECVFACGCISAFVSVLNVAGNFLITAFYAEEYMIFWILAAVVLVLELVKEFRRTTNQMEELV